MTLFNRQEADIAAASAALTYNRFTDFDMTPYFYMDMHGIGYQEPEIEPNILGFILTFTTTVTMSIILF